MKCFFFVDRQSGNTQIKFRILIRIFRVRNVRIKWKVSERIRLSEREIQKEKLSKIVDHNFHKITVNRLQNARQ